MLPPKLGGDKEEAMGQHAKRFAAVNAQKGTGLRAVADQLKTIADTAEEWFDPNSPEVVGAMQRFEQGLALLSTAPAHPEAGESAGDKPKAPKRSNTRRASEKDVAASGKGDTPESEGAESGKGDG
jgi:hypothetical protein